MNVSSSEPIDHFADVERVLIEACAFVPQNKRVLGALLSWLLVHGEVVNIERLLKFSKDQALPWLSLCARFCLFHGNTRWKNVVGTHEGLHANGDIDNAKERVKFKGGEPWAKDS